MLSTALLRNEAELLEFYQWLLSRAQEEEKRGKTDHGRVYRDYAKTISQQIFVFENAGGLANPPGPVISN